MFNKFLNILFPEPCPVCQKISSDHKIAPICTECWQTILPYSGYLCRRCGTPLASDISIICGECLKDEPAFKSARSFGLYDGALRKAINLLKYRGIKRLSKPLSDIILTINPAPEKTRCGVKIPQVDAIIPVPLYEKRLRQREFNQSALLAKHMAKRSGITLILNCLVKIKDTIPQVGLSSKDRIKNVRKAFEIRNKELIKGKNFFLVDDVFTTGATVRECSKVLKKAGAEDIYVLTLAHGVRD